MWSLLFQLESRNITFRLVEWFTVFYCAAVYFIKLQKLKLAWKQMVNLTVMKHLNTLSIFLKTLRYTLTVKKDASMREWREALSSFHGGALFPTEASQSETRCACKHRNRWALIMSNRQSYGITDYRIFNKAICCHTHILLFVYSHTFWDIFHISLSERNKYFLTMWYVTNLKSWLC